MSRFSDSSELREAAELLNEIFRPESTGDTQKSVVSIQDHAPIRRSDAPVEINNSKAASNISNQVDTASDRTKTKSQSKTISMPDNSQRVPIPAQQNIEGLTAFSRSKQQEKSNVSSPLTAVENRIKPEAEPEPEKNTPFATILANQQSQKKRLESNSPFRAFQDGNSDITKSKTDNSTATANTNGSESTAERLEKARNEINSLDRATRIQESNSPQVESEDKTAPEDKTELASVSAQGKQNTLIPASTFGTNSESNSVQNETQPKRPVWPWERKEENPKPIVAIPEANSNNTIESEDAKKNPGWPWTQK